MRAPPQLLRFPSPPSQNPPFGNPEPLTSAIFSDVAQMWFGCGSDMGRMQLGCGSDVARTWLGHVLGCLPHRLAEVKGKRFPAGGLPGNRSKTSSFNGTFRKFCQDIPCLKNLCQKHLCLLVGPTSLSFTLSEGSEGGMRRDSRSFGTLAGNSSGKAWPRAKRSFQKFWPRFLFGGWF